MPQSILIVDDNERIAQTLARLFQSEGYATEVTHRGADALDSARSRSFAAALVDIHLPDINGLVVAQRLRGVMGPAAPIVIVSGDTSMEVINTLHHVGATYFFSKPLNVQYLLERMKQWTSAVPVSPAEAATQPPADGL